MAYNGTKLPESAAKFQNVPVEYRAGLRYGLPLSWIGMVKDNQYLLDELDRTLNDLRDKGFSHIETGGQGSGRDEVEDGQVVSDNWKKMFKMLLKKCNEMDIHIQLSGICDTQPTGLLEPDSDGNENYRPKRLYATEPAENLSGTVTSLTLEGESINSVNKLIAVAAVRWEKAPDGGKTLMDSRLLEDFVIETTPIPESERSLKNSARIKIEQRMDKILESIDMSAVLRGCSGRVNDDGTPNSTPVVNEPGPSAAPPAGGPPMGDAPEGAPAGGPPAGGPGGPGGGPGGPGELGMGFSPPGYEKRSIQEPASHAVTVTYKGSGFTLADGNWDIIAYYELCNPKNTHTPNPGAFSLGGDKKYTITNCFSAAGAEKVIDTYERYIFDDEIRELFRQNKGGLFYDGGDGDPRCDDVTWTEDLPQAFEDYTGYSLLPYLPVIYSGYELPGDGEKRLLTEKYKVLSILYKSFLTRMSQWLEGYNAGYHHQVAYSTTLETQEAMRGLSRPEVESLNYMSNPGAYIAATSAARLEGNKLVSCEMGATFRNPYDGTLRNLMTEINTALVSGVNQMKLHTSTFVYGEGAKWPGCNIHYSSLPDFNATQPFWHEMDLFGPAICRGQYAVRRGVARRDLMLYLRRFMEPEGNYDCCDSIVRAGYTYDFYDAEMMRDAGAVSDGVIQPEKAAFKAIVVEQDKLFDGRMPTMAAEAILGYAKAGIPVVVSGAVPSRTEGLEDSDERLAQLWQDIRATGKLMVVPTNDDIPAALAEMGVRPNLEPEKPSGVTSWLSDDEGIRCYYVFNQSRTYYHVYPQAADVCQKFSFKAQGDPYEVNIWTGEITPVTGFQRQGEYVTFTLDMAAGEAKMFIFGGESSLDAPEKPKVYGQSLNLDQGWILQLESWSPAMPYGTSAAGPEGALTKKELLAPVALEALAPWKDIPGVPQSVSGVGYYTISFDWDGQYTGAELCLGSCYDTVRVWVNGVEAHVDQLGLRGQIGHLLKKGANTLMVRTTSGLCNVLYDLGAIPNEFGYSAFGLTGPVTIKRFNRG